jgi:threonine 3-dehydrogenase
MKALVKQKDEPGLWLEEVPIPQVGINDVLIQIHKSSICGTDVHIYDWDAWAQKTITVPTVIGHEYVGRVAEVGSNVTGFKPADLVSGEGHLVCGFCRNCLAGRRHLCPHTRGVGVNRDGAFAEYLCIPMTNVWYADRNLKTDLLCCSDPLRCWFTSLSLSGLHADPLRSKSKG